MYLGKHVEHIETLAALERTSVKDPAIFQLGQDAFAYTTVGEEASLRFDLALFRVPSLQEPWQYLGPVARDVPYGREAVAPTVIVEGEHVFVAMQEKVTEEGGGIHLWTANARDPLSLSYHSEILRPDPGMREVNVYDAGFYRIAGGENKCGILFTSATRIHNRECPQTHNTFYLIEGHVTAAVADRWEGPYRRLGTVIDHDLLMEWHNQPSSIDVPPAFYESCQEGASAVVIHQGGTLILAVVTGFLRKDGSFEDVRCFGECQRNILLMGESFETLVPLGLVPKIPGSSESGHAHLEVLNAALQPDPSGTVVAVVQQWRRGEKDTWHIGATFLDMPDLLEAYTERLDKRRRVAA